MDRKIEQVRREIKQYRQQVSLKDATIRLLENKDFKEVIERAFCTEECARYVQVSTDVSMSKEDRDDALGTAQAAGYLKRFLHACIQLGERAEESAEESQRHLDELMVEVPPTA